VWKKKKGKKGGKKKDRTKCLLVKGGKKEKEKKRKGKGKNRKGLPAIKKSVHSTLNVALAKEGK